MLSHSHNNGSGSRPRPRPAHRVTSHFPGLSSPVSLTVGQLNKDVEEDEVFMQLELPLERDSGSGSGDTSPTSPASPAQAVSPTPTQADLSQALSSLDSNTLMSSPPPVRRFGSPAFISDVLDPAALISIDVMLVSPACPTLEEDEELRIVNIQFNSLDVIANQETIIELISFSRRVFPPEQSAFKSPFSK